MDWKKYFPFCELKNVELIVDCNELIYISYFNDDTNCALFKTDYLIID